jgi:hypothetical protein
VSAATFDSQLATAIEALAGTPTRFDSDRIIVQRIPAGSTYYALRVDVIGEDGREDANTVRELAGFEIDVKYRLGAAEAERTYTVGNMLTIQSSLISRTFYRDLAAVYKTAEDKPPEVSEEAERVGRIISFTVSGVVFLA